MVMLKGNTAAGKSQRSNSEVRPLNRKTLDRGTEDRHVIICYTMKQSHLTCTHTFGFTVTICFHSDCVCKRLICMSISVSFCSVRNRSDSCCFLQ